MGIIKFDKNLSYLIAMGRVRTKTVKGASRRLIENYYQILTEDFDTNKRVIDQVAEIQTKRLRNKIAGFTTHLMKRIRNGPVRGVSIKLQEEERDRRKDNVAIDPPQALELNVDKDTYEMVQTLGLEKLPDLKVSCSRRK